MPDEETTAGTYFYSDYSTDSEVVLVRGRVARQSIRHFRAKTTPGGALDQIVSFGVTTGSGDLHRPRAERYRRKISRPFGDLEVSAERAARVAPLSKRATGPGKTSSRPPDLSGEDLLPVIALGQRRLHLHLQADVPPMDPGSRTGHFRRRASCNAYVRRTACQRLRGPSGARHDWGRSTRPTCRNQRKIGLAVGSSPPSLIRCGSQSVRFR
jgi:hypothetical protein